MPQTRDTTPKTVSRSRHVEMLVLSCLALIGAFLLNVGPGERVHLAFMPDYPLPQTCFTKELFGFQCPGCGLTRSFIYIAELDVGASFNMHRIGWLLFLATLIQVPYRTYALSSKDAKLLPIKLAKGIGTTLIILLLLNWIAGILFANSLAGN